MSLKADTEHILIIGEIARKIKDLMKENPENNFDSIYGKTIYLHDEMINGLLQDCDKQLAQSIVNEMIYYLCDAYNFPIKEPKKIW